MQVAAFLGDCDNFRPRPHQTHLPPDNVDELRQFIEAEAPQESAESGVARIIVVLVLGTSIGNLVEIDLAFAAVGLHRTKLVNRKGLLTGAYALLAVEHTLPKASPDSEGDPDDDGTGNNKNEKPANGVDGPLKASLIGRLTTDDPKIIGRRNSQTFCCLSRLDLCHLSNPYKPHYA